MADTFRLDIVTPERTVFSGPAEELTAPGILGEFGVLPGHANMLAELGVGRVRYRSGGNEQILLAGGGYAEVTGESVTVLLERALFPEEIQIEEASRALEIAKQNVYAPNEEQYAEWQQSLEWLGLCIQMAGDSTRKGQQ